MRETFAFMAPWRELTSLRSAANACEPDLTRCREEREGRRGVFTQQAYLRACHGMRKTFALMASWREPDQPEFANAHEQNLTPCREERQGSRRGVDASRSSNAPVMECGKPLRAWRLGVR
jgi:hypothetical protein